MKDKRVPERMCVACRGRGCKAEFIRIVNNGGVLAVGDKLDGRGAYIHQDLACLKVAVKKGSLNRALRCKVPEDIYKQLESEMNA